MSTQAVSAVEAVVEQEQDVAVGAPVAPVVDRGLVEQLVAGARGQECPSRTCCDYVNHAH